jgi:hypothetical protein
VLSNGSEQPGEVVDLTERSGGDPSGERPRGATGGSPPAAP